MTRRTLWQEYGGAASFDTEWLRTEMSLLVSKRFQEIEALPQPHLRNCARAVLLALGHDYRERLCEVWSLDDYLAALQRHDTIRTHEAARAIMAELDAPREMTDD